LGGAIIPEGWLSLPSKLVGAGSRLPSTRAGRGKYQRGVYLSSVNSLSLLGMRPSETQRALGLLRCSCWKPTWTPRNP